MTANVISSNPPYGEKKVLFWSDGNTIKVVDTKDFEFLYIPRPGEHVTIGGVRYECETVDGNFDDKNVHIYLKTSFKFREFL